MDTERKKECMSLLVHKTVGQIFISLKDNFRKDVVIFNLYYVLRMVMIDDSYYA